MLRRAASGHIEATQLLKFAAASRIALAVIRGWPEAPSSPLQGGGALLAAGAGCACAEVPGCAPDGAVWPPFERAPLKMLSKKLGRPRPLDDCACAAPPGSSALSTAPSTVSLTRVPVMAVIDFVLFPKASDFQEALSRFPTD